MDDLLLLAQQIANKIVESIDSIDLIYLYGGVAQGRAHDKSDIDMMIVKEDGFVFWSFIINDRPVYILTSTWNQLEERAIGRSGDWSIIAGSIVKSKVLWAKSQEMVEKFNQIKNKALTGSTRSLQQSINNFDSLYGKLWRLQKAIVMTKTADCRFLIWDIANKIVDILAALNRQYLMNNWGKQSQEFNKMKIIPNDFTNRFKKLVTSDPEEALPIANNLVEEVNVLLKKWIIENQTNFETYLVEIKSDWVTVIEFLNKAKLAKERNDLSAGLYAATDNARFDLWTFATLRKIRWNKSSFFSATEVITQLPIDIQRDLKILLESTNLENILLATENLANVLTDQLKQQSFTLPIVFTLDEAMKFIQQH
ncbi:MAG: nucleotidyltransferase domain-containing protein [Candidatus Heimdallarchaeota archaeon]|nr:nucleotidyltransferase domain-containing protein [Candidatus Heimdallarchaeota archaeon]